jgi:hypothetical protein
VSKKFYIEFHPFQKVATTAVFSLPQADQLVNRDELKKNSEAGLASAVAAAALANGHSETPEQKQAVIK